METTTELTPPLLAPATDPGRGAAREAGARRVWRAVGATTADHVGLLLALAALVVVLALTADNFLTSENLLDVARQAAFTGIIAFGMTLVIVAAEIDISVGSAIGFGSALLGVLVA